MKQILSKLIIVLILSGVAIGFLISTSVAIGDTERRSAFMGGEVWDDMQAAEQSIIQRRERIKAELSAFEPDKLDNGNWAKEWAGWYYDGDGLGRNVSINIAPNSGISFLNYGCLGLYGADHGDIAEVLPDGLKLELAFGDAKNSFLSERVYFVRWGSDRFLIPDWQMMEFVNNYNEGGYARSEMFGIPRQFQEGSNPHHHRSAAERPTGKPEVPEQFAEMLLDQPVALKVSSVSDYRTKVNKDNSKSQKCKVVFDRGTDAGIQVGMEFKYSLDHQSRVFGNFRITFADTGISTGEFTVISRNGKAANLPACGEIVLAGYGESKTND